MADSRELAFPNLEEERPDPALRQRLANSYAAQPAASDAQVVACTQAVLAAAAAQRAGIRPRWWWGAAAAAVLVVSVSRPWRPQESQQRADSAVTAAAPLGAPVGSTTEVQNGAVHFELALPTSASQVAIVGDFNGWDERATPMVRDGAEWSARVALPPGRHVYAFVINGTQWLVDPIAPQVPDAGYGPANAVIVDPR